MGELQGILGIATKKIFSSSKSRNDNIDRLFFSKEKSRQKWILSSCSTTFKKVVGRRGDLSTAKTKTNHNKNEKILSDTIGRNYFSKNLRIQCNPHQDVTLNPSSPPKNYNEKTITLKSKRYELSHIVPLSISKMPGKYSQSLKGSFQKDIQSQT